MWSGPSRYALAATERRRDKKKHSPAFQIISLFHAHEGYQQGRSNIRTDHAHQAIMRDCIRYGVRFDLDDFAVIRGAGEWEYGIACGSERGILNPSAAQAYEKFVGRTPFLIADEGTVTPTRIYVGRQFKWKGKDVTCTSFAADQKTFTACSYKPDPKGLGYSRDVEKRFAISHEDIYNERKESKERVEIHAKLVAVGLAGEKGTSQKIIDALGIISKDEFEGLPIKKIRAVAKTFGC
jgi:hypothetical protein